MDTSSSIIQKPDLHTQTLVLLKHEKKSLIPNIIYLLSKKLNSSQFYFSPKKKKLLVASSESARTCSVSSASGSHTFYTFYLIYSILISCFSSTHYPRVS